MKIEFSIGVKKCRFGELKPGDCFRFYDYGEPSTEVYMKVSGDCLENPIVNLGSGEIYSDYLDSTEVFLLDATVVVK